MLENAGIQIRFKQKPGHFPHSLIRLVRDGVPNVLFIHMVDHQADDGVLVACVGVDSVPRMIGDTVSGSVGFRHIPTGCQVHIFFGRLGRGGADFLFLRCEETIFPDKLGDAPLHLCPRPYRLSVCAGDGEAERQLGVAAILAGKPHGGVLVAGMAAHVLHHPPLAVRVAVPALEGLVNIGLCELIGRGGRRGLFPRCFRGGALCLVAGGEQAEYTALRVSLRHSGDRDIIFFTQPLNILFQPVRREAAHLHTARARYGAGRQGKAQQGRGGLGVLAVQFKEIPHLIKHHVAGAAALYIVVLLIRGCKGGLCPGNRRSGGRLYALRFLCILPLFRLRLTC